LQFKLLFENEVEIPKHLHLTIFGDKHFAQGIVMRGFCYGLFF
jgi:hypothetical protein